MMEGIVLDFNLHFRVIFSEFVQVHEVTLNKRNPITSDSITLGSNGNFQGGVRCFRLAPR